MIATGSRFNFENYTYMYPMAANHDHASAAGLTFRLKEKIKGLSSLQTPDRGLRQCKHILSSLICNS